ncbi:MAG: adenosylcobinamide-GDP ribazoletransferase [Elusimicrobia bacterium]|nr:adenosylcobinamide-GDP ribazoletransferase [Elusimicrobiota bacterium]
MFKSFFTAVGFLTIIPVPKKYSREFRHSIIFFPIAGLLIGGILTGIYLLFSKFTPKIVTDFLVLAVLTSISGGIHIDGLADTLDGFYGGKDKSSIIGIMDDPHPGTIGITGIILILLGKFLLLYSLPLEHVFQALILTAVISRFCMTLPIAISKPAKEGLGKTFISSAKGIDCLIAGILTVIIILTFTHFELSVLTIFAAVILFTLIFTKLSEYKIGGITGDILGFINEISEVLTLLIVIILIC